MSINNGIITCNISLFGPSVGKTSLLYQYLENKEPNEGISKLWEPPDKYIEIGVDTIKLHLYMNNDKNNFEGLNKLFIPQTNIVILIYDITNRDSFNLMKEYYYPQTIKSLPQNIIIGISGNKVDLERKREVSYKEGEEFSLSINAIFQETTSKEHEKITKLIDDLIRKYIEYYKGENDNIIEDDGACCNEICSVI